MRLKLACSLGVWLSPCLLLAAGPYDKAIDVPMYRLPDLPVPRVEFIFPKGAKALWLRALERPEADLRCKAAHAIALAHRDGVKGFETTIGPLLAVFDRADAPPTVRLAVAEALIALEAREAADSLFRQAQSGDSDLRERVEPVLARWDHRPARAVWLARLREPSTPQRNLVLAIRGLSAVREEQAAERLRAIVLGERIAGPIRLEAARALGTLRMSGLESEAERLASDASPRGLVARLLAAALLRRHRGAEAIRLLQRLAQDPEPTVAANAVARLLEIDPELLVPTVELLLSSPDAKLRSFGIDVLRRRPSEKHVRLLTGQLDDTDSEARLRARRYLRELAGEKEWRNPILTEATALLKTRQWRGLEQATILLTQLDRKPAAARLVELLSFERPEVSLSAAWGLRKLAVPETLPGVAAYVENQLKRPPDPQGSLAGIRDHVLSQLNQFLGQQTYRPADALLRRFIPKNMNARTGPESRAAALWALGLIHEGRTVDSLAVAAEARLHDTNSMPPEDLRVRRMSALLLGRLKAKKAVDSLRQYYTVREPSDDTVSNACGWALEQITGEVVPPPKTVRKARHNWFLVPAEG